MYSQIEQKIISDLQSWSKDALEYPNENYNNLPACPYAKSAWKNDKVGFLDDLNQDISDGKYNTKDMYLMGFHPDDESNEFLDESLDMDDEDIPPYAMIFYQRLSKLQEASDSLRIKGYYDLCEDYYNAESLYERRKSIYRRLKNG